METINVKGKDYRFVQNYRDDAKLRDGLNQLTMKIYGFDFEDWYNQGYWGDNYIPYSLLDGDAIISNISITLMEFLFEGQKRSCLQIGTVMTAPEYRNKGLNRIILEKVLGQWRGKCDLIYLFANDTVLDFYPKFGFERVQEYRYSLSVDSLSVDRQNLTAGSEAGLRQLDMSNKEHEAFALPLVQKSAPVSWPAMSNNHGLVFFWLMFVYGQRVFYLEALDTLVIMNREGEQLYLMDVFCDKPVELTDILPHLISKETKKVILGFTPQNKSQFEEDLLHPDDVLFIMDDKYDLCTDKHFMFPVLSHA